MDDVRIQTKKTNNISGFTLRNVRNFLFLYKWTDYAVNILGWSPETCGAIVEDYNPTLYKENNNVTEIFTVNTAAPSLMAAKLDPAKINCNCNQSSMWYADCETYPCKVLRDGCGGFGFFECNGVHMPMTIILN